MSRIDSIKPVYVQYIPPSDTVREGELYISLEFQTAIHKCCCGCGEEVVTPFNPAQWKLSDNDGKVSLNPSIGNWSYPCQSHYFVRDNRIIWAGTLNSAAIEQVQLGDQRALERYIANKNADNQVTGSTGGFLQRLIKACQRLAKKILDLISSG